MKTRLHSIAGKFSPILLLLAALTGCINEDRSDCFDGVNVLVRMDQSQAGGSQADDVRLYVFDSEGNHLETRETATDRWELFRYPDAGALHFVTWLNTGAFEFNGFPAGNRMNRLADIYEEGQLTLKRTSAGSSYSMLPTDLFYGAIEADNVKNSGTIEEKTIIARRKVGAMNITVRGLQTYTGYYDDNFSIIVGPTGSSYNFAGSLAGDSGSAEHILRSSFDSNGEYKIETFKLMPSGSVQTEIAIMHDDTELIFRTDRDNNGNPIVIEPDKTYNILIEFKGSAIVVTVEKTEWGAVYVWEQVFP